MESLNSNSQERELYQLQQMQHKAKESCMKSFRLLQSHLQVLSYNDLKINGCLERAFATLFEQDVQTFTGIMLLNLDQQEKQLDKNEFQGDRSMAAFCVINKQFQMFIDTQFTWDYDNQMTEKYFAEYTGIEVKQYRETLLLHMGNVMKSLAERTRHKRQYDRRMNERQMQSRESKVVSSKALDASLVVIECGRTKSNKHDTSSSSRTYITHAVDVDIRTVNDQVPFAEVDSNNTPNSTNMCHRGGEIDQDAKQYQAKSPLLKAELVKSKEMIEKETYNELSRSVKDASNEAKVKNDIDVIETINIELEHSVVAKVFFKQSVQRNEFVENADLVARIQEKVFANASLKNELRKLKGNSMDTKFAKPSILGKPVLQSLRNQSIVRQPNAFKSERPNFSKPQFASQVDVNNVLSKPVTPYYLPKVREYVLVKPNHVIASGSSRNSQEVSYGSNDMAHNHYLEEARKKSQERNRNSKPSVMHTTSLQNTTIGQRFSPKKSSAVHEKPNTPRSCLRWKPTGRMFKTAGLRWIPTGKMFTDSTTKVDIETPNGSNEDINNPYECEQTLNVSAEQQERAHFDDPCHELLHKVYISQGSSSKCTQIIKRTNAASADNTSGPAPQRKERKRGGSLSNTSFLGAYECSSLALELRGRDEKKRLDHLIQDQEMIVIKIFSERKKVFRERKKCEKIRAKRDCMMVVKEIVSRLLEEVERSWNGGLSKTLMMKENRIKKGWWNWTALGCRLGRVKDYRKIGNSQYFWFPPGGGPILPSGVLNYWGASIIKRMRMRMDDSGWLEEELAFDHEVFSCHVSMRLFAHSEELGDDMT
ncbi:hypothetical protein Tco_1215088 [Tanacetum coccineum]